MNFNIKKTEKYDYSYAKELNNLEFEIRYSEHVWTCALRYRMALLNEGPEITVEKAQELRDIYDMERSEFK